MSHQKDFAIVVFRHILNNFVQVLVDKSLVGNGKEISRRCLSGTPLIEGNYFKALLGEFRPNVVKGLHIVAKAMIKQKFAFEGNIRRSNLLTSISIYSAI